MMPSKNPPPLYFQSFPSFKQWTIYSFSPDHDQKRSTDTVIKRIDDLVRSIEKAGDDGQRKYMMCELFFSTNYWMRHHWGPHMPGMQRLQTAVGALKDLVQRELSRVFGCSSLEVLAMLEKHYCCSETAHGIFTDTQDQPRSFEARCKLEKFKIYFQKGRAMWHVWWSSENSALVPVDSSKAAKGTKDDRDDLLQRGHGFFVMTRYRDLYLAPFSPSCQVFPKYHSTIPNGKAVQCAGSMLIVEGVIKEISNSSGHYMPNNLYFVNVLEQLKTMGVTDLKSISLYDHDGNQIAPDAEKYLAEYGKWRRVEERGVLYQERRPSRASALRAQQYKRRLDELEAVNSKDKALAILFAEQFAEASKSQPGSPSLWTETWKGILNDLIAFHKEGGLGATPRVKFYTDKLTAYQGRPPIPPKPKDQTNLVYV